MADFLRSPLLASHGVCGLFTLRSGGVSPTPFDSLNFGSDLGDKHSHIDKNLAQLLKQSDINGKPHQVIQEHQADTLYCSGPGFQHDHKADILLTDQPDTPIAVRTADCLPILLADTDAGIAAAVHAGWRGTAAQVASVAVEKMLGLGARTERIIASLGPCIGPCCFTIGDEAAEALAECCEGAASCITESEKKHADLWAINRLQLLDSGLKETHIEVMRSCTCCHPQQFFSYRRDNGITGRHLAVVTLPTYP